MVVLFVSVSCISISVVIAQVICFTEVLRTMHVCSSMSREAAHAKGVQSLARGNNRILMVAVVEKDTGTSGMTS